MKTKFEELVISKEEYNFFLTLSKQERLDYIFGLYDASSESINALDLGKFFSALHENLHDTAEQEEQLVESKLSELPKNVNRVDVMIDDDNIMIEANSLKALRLVFNKFVEAGYILQRDLETEKLFRKDKMTRYLRVFYIVDQISGICFN